MISKTSFFNKAIYKSEMKRFSWGSILYFILLFLSTGLNALLSIDPNNMERYGSYYENASLILRNDYVIFPLLMAVAVSVVAAILIFRFNHSKNQAVFMHSLPVSRRANYISSVLAGLTHMTIPIILNGIILTVISLCGYGEFFTPADCVLWVGINLFSVFILFSVSVFSSVITGNAFAAVAVTALIHGFAFILISALEVMTSTFVFGFDGMSGVYDLLVENNFVGFSTSLSSPSFRENVTPLKITELLLIAFAIYIAAYFLYKKRRIETASDVAGFKCLNQIFKYAVSFLGTLFAFAVFVPNIENNIYVFGVVLLIASAVFYFGSEMLLKKTFKVISSYKGYIVLAAVFAACVYVFAGTGFFGYETRVPEIEKIKNATAVSYYNYPENIPYTEDEELIKTIVDFHKNTVSGEIPVLNRIEGNYAITKIRYELKNGMIMERRYYVSEEANVKLMNKLYENDDYKMKCEEIFLNDHLITNVYINYEKTLKEKDEFLKIVRAEILKLSYEQISEGETSGNHYGIRIEYKVDSADINGEPQSFVSGRYINLNRHYAETLKWLEEKGYKPI